MDDSNKAVSMFCAEQQQDTPHSLVVDGNGEIVLTCLADGVVTYTVEGGERTPHASPCGRFIKLPADSTADDVKVYLEAHKAANQGQISQDSIEAKRVELLEGLADVLVDAPAEAVQTKETA